MATPRPARGYSALIRTYNSEATLSDTLESLERQTLPPAEYVIVDSGSTDGTLTLLRENSRVHEYTGGEFNFSSAINQGVDHVETPFTLIISSHTAVGNLDAIRFLIDVLESDSRLDAAYLCDERLEGRGEPAASGELALTVVDAATYTGYNGTWNSCALYRTETIRDRPFRPEVFSAEDAEWSRWLIEERGQAIGRVSGGELRYENRHQQQIRKRVNEHLAIALFVKPEQLRLAYLARVAYRVVRPVSTSWQRRFNGRLLLELVRTRFGWRPSSSRYF